MKLYHGSKAGIVGAIAPTSRGCCDFGRVMCGATGCGGMWDDVI